MPDMQEHPDAARAEEKFLERVMRYLEGKLSPAGVADLQREMFADAAKRELFVAICFNDSLCFEELPSRPQQRYPDLVCLEQEDAPEADPLHGQESLVCPAQSEPDSLVSAAGEETEQALPPNAPAIDFPQNSHPRRRWFAWGRAALILLPLAAAAVWGVLASRATRIVLVATVNDRWTAPGTSFRIGDRLPAGELSLEAGMAEIELGDGTRMVLEGPCRLGVHSERAVELHLGKLSVAVGVNAHGFAVQTPSSRIVDLGTQFGVLVDGAGDSETHVFLGTVDCTPLQGGATLRLTADHAARVEAGSTTASETVCRRQDFMQRLASIDLIDVVAGGDGAQGHRDGGIDVATGSAVEGPPDGENGGRLERDTRIKGDGQFHRCSARPLIAGVFVPRGGAAADVLDPAGHRFNFPETDNQSYNWLWAGGSIPVSGSHAALTLIGDTDYSAPGHGVLLMHANKGVCFDLGAIKRIHPDRPFTRFGAVCVNAAGRLTVAQPPSQAELRVFVDGKLAFQKSPLLRTAPPFMLDVPIKAGATYLTLVVTDGGDGVNGDWVILGDPKLD